MSANIKRLSTFLDNRLVTLDFQGYKVINLSGAEENKDSILYTLERFLARDFESYYNEIDSNLGVTYKSIKGSSTLQFLNGLSMYSDSKLVNRGTLPNIHCIRYLDKDRVRSFLLSSDSSNDIIGVNMTRFNSEISDSKWNRLVALVTKLVGYDFIKLDTKKREISFDIHPFNDWSEEAIKLVYLLVSESMLTPDKYTRVTLLSEISILSSKQVQELINTLSSISRNELIIFSNNLPNDSLSTSYKVLNLSV